MDLYKIGQLCGFLALTCLVLQPVLASRLKLLDRLFGLDKIMRFHALNGKLLFLFVLLHPTLLLGPKLLKGTSLTQIISTFTFFHWLGVIAFLLICFTLVITLWQAKVVKNYEHWKFLHKVGYLIIVSGFLHSFFVGSDIAERGKAYYFWILLLVLAGSAIFYKYVIRYFLLKDNIWKVKKIVMEGLNVRSVFLKPIRKQTFDYKPGQFAFVKFYSKRVPSEEHHFTISSAPEAPGRVPGDTGGMISFTVKELGDYTKTLGSLQVGDRARIEGPFGKFTNYGKQGPFVFIAGGIGITPLMSMIRSMEKTQTPQKATLIYSVKGPQDLVFKNELDRLSKKTNWFDVEFVVGLHIDSKLIAKKVEDFTNSKFFVCGPDGFMAAMKKLLVDNGASKEVIFTEKFSLK